jgi:hypothetical protein
MVQLEDRNHDRYFNRKGFIQGTGYTVVGQLKENAYVLQKILSIGGSYPSRNEQKRKDITRTRSVYKSAWQTFSL